MTRVEPNPPSPYATAAPDVRHLFAVPAFMKAPPPRGDLAPTACGQLAVVPDRPMEIPAGGQLPDGVCEACARAHASGTVADPTGPVTDCGRCGLRTRHGGLCVFCRGELHRAARRAAARTRPACGGEG